MERTYKITVQVPEPLYRKWKIIFAKESGSWQGHIIALLKESLKMRRDQKEESAK